MRSNWKYLPLGEVADFFSGGTPKKSVDEYWQGGEIPWISAATLKDSMVSTSETMITQQGLSQGSRLAKKDDILLLVRGSGLFKGIPMARVISDVAFNQDIKAIRAKPVINPKFLFASLFGLRSKLEELLEFTGIGAGKIDLKKLKELRIPVPSPSEQNWVAELLGRIDAKIANNRALAADLEAIARAIFKSWFVGFDPVKAKMEGRTPAGMDADTAAFFPDELVESELGVIPKGWEPAAISELCEIVGGATPSTKNPDFWDGGTHMWATPKDLSALQAPILRVTARQITNAGVAKISSGLLPVGTVLLSSRAPIGYLAIASVPTAINQGFIAMKPKTNVSNIFLLLWASLSMDEIIASANGSTFQEISKKAFRPIRLVKPSREVMREFDHIVRPLFNRIETLEHESAELSEFRDSLLPRLISGKIRLPEAQSLTEETAA